MFGKYLINTLRKHTLTYAIIAICEVIMIVISMFALSVILEHASNNPYEIRQAYSKFFSYKFEIYDVSDHPILTEEEKAELLNTETLLKASVMRERIYEFCDKSPIKINNMNVGLDHMKYNYWNMVMYFQTYEDMYKYLTEHKDNPLPAGSLPTREQFENHEKIVLLSTGQGSDSDEYVFSDEQHLLFGNDGDEYLIVSKIPWNALVLFLGSEPDDAKVSEIYFELDSIPTQEQVDEIHKLFNDIVIREYAPFCSYTKIPEIKNLLDLRKEASTIIITALLMIIMSFNYMTIIKFMIEKRKNDYAVFRLCGFSKRKAMTFPMLETLGISAVCVVVSCLLFELLKPLIVLYSPVVYSMFDLWYYLCFSLGLILITMILFLIYVLPTLNKSVSDELREM